MNERDPAQFLPWMCAGLVLSVELMMKGLLTAIVVGASALALLVFVLIALNLYMSADVGSAYGRVWFIEPRRNGTPIEHAQKRPETLFTTPRIQDTD